MPMVSRIFLRIQVEVVRVVTPCNFAAGYQLYSPAIFHHSTTRRHNPEDFDLNFHRRENLKKKSPTFREVTPILEAICLRHYFLGTQFASCVFCP
jgi:hypothetical protein